MRLPGLSGWLALGLFSFSLPAGAASAPGFIFQKSNDLPVTTFNVTFRTGSADDPHGEEGIAGLTAALLREGGVTKYGIGPQRAQGESDSSASNEELPARSRAELEEFFYPMAAEVHVSVEAEQTSFRVTTTADDAEPVFRVLVQMIMAPAFESQEFDRLKAEVLDALSKQLPREDEEELGKAALVQSIYGPGHPYSHVVDGTIKAVTGLDVEKIRKFYETHLTRRRLTVGVGGVVRPELEALISTAFQNLPEGDSDRADIPAVNQPTELGLKLVKGPFDAVGVHLGTPLPFNRASRDFAPMFLASWAFGKHRSFVGRLMHKMREVRGLNYGDYSYVENFPMGGQVLAAPTQSARTRQAFTVWGRPTPPENGCFLVRALVRETDQLARHGLTLPEFKLARSHLIGNAPIMAAGLERRLGFAIDSRFYGIEGDFLKRLQDGAKAATFASVNGDLKKFLTPEHYDLVVVAADPDKMKAELLAPNCPIHYAKGVTQVGSVLREDRLMGAYPLGLKPQNMVTVDAESVFEK